MSRSRFKKQGSEGYHAHTIVPQKFRSIAVIASFLLEFVIHSHGTEMGGHDAARAPSNTSISIPSHGGRWRHGHGQYINTMLDARRPLPDVQVGVVLDMVMVTTAEGAYPQCTSVIDS